MDLDWRRVGLVAAALVLLANPLLVPNPAQPSYTYRAAPLAVTDQGVERQATEGGILRQATDEEPVELPGVDCQTDRDGVLGGSYLCLYDLQALERGSVTLSVNASVVTTIGGRPNEYSDPDDTGAYQLHLGGRRYTRIGGRYYERIHTPSNGTYRLKPATTRQVLDNVSVSYPSFLPYEIGPVDPRPLRRRVVDRGRVTMAGEYIDRSVVRKDGPNGTVYYHVWQSDTDPPLVPAEVDRRFVTVARWLLFFLGAGLLYRVRG